MSLHAALQSLANDMAGELDVGEVNVFENMDLAMEFGVRATPTLMLFRDGRIVWQTIGAPPLEKLKTHLQSLI